MAVDGLFEIVSANAPRFIKSAVNAAGETLLADIKARAFPSNASEGGDADGGKIKQGRAYSPAWAKVRKEKGRQVGFVDLQFTDNLFRNGIKGSDVVEGYVIDYTNSAFAEQVADIERKYKQTIFAASKDEAEKALDTIETLFFRQINDLVNEVAAK